MSLKIEELTESGLGRFIDFPYSLFKSHPFWIGELKKDTKHLLGLGHPFWLHSRRALFMALRDGRPVGRIAAIVNESHNSFHNEKCGFFGFFDCEDDSEAAAGLFDKACAWLRASGMDIVRGPANPSSNETWGFLSEGFDSPPMVMMPYNPPYYLTLAENSGFSKAKELFAFRHETNAGLPERVEKILSRMTRNRDTVIKKVDISNLEGAIAELKDIYNSAWEKNWGFVPMSSAEIDDLGNALKPLLKPDFLFFARVSGKPAGFVLLLPDFNIPLKGAGGVLTPKNILPFLYRMFFRINRGRLLALGVKKEYRNKGIEMLLVKQSILAAKKMGWEYGELSWTLEDNTAINSTIETIGGRIYKKYRVYQKKL